MSGAPKVIVPDPPKVEAAQAPLPWRAVREDEYHTYIESADGPFAMTFGTWADAPGEHKRIAGNAALIVRAVNNHAAYRAALAATETDLREWALQAALMGTDGGHREAQRMLARAESIAAVLGDGGET